MFPRTPRSPKVLKYSVGLKQNSECVLSARHPLLREFVPLLSCKRDISLHLKSVKLAKSSVSSENELILLRVGLFDSTAHGKTVSLKHRDLLGLSWRPPRTCKYPLHEKKTGKKCDRGISKQMLLETYERLQTFVPIGSGKHSLNC